MTSMYSFLDCDDSEINLRILTRCQIAPMNRANPCICVITFHSSEKEVMPPLYLTAHNQPEIDILVWGPVITAPGLYEVTLTCPEIPSLNTTVTHAVDKQDLIYSQSQ